MILRFYVKDYKNKQMKCCGQIWSLEKSLILYPFGFDMISSLEMLGLVAYQTHALLALSFKKLGMIIHQTYIYLDSDMWVW
jgi:hypothetical protein